MELVLIFTIFFVFELSLGCCHFSNGDGNCVEFSVEEATSRSPIVFHGQSVIVNPFKLGGEVGGEAGGFSESNTIAVSFELLNTFKGSTSPYGYWSVTAEDTINDNNSNKTNNANNTDSFNNPRRLKVEFLGNCGVSNDFFEIPGEYIIFGNASDEDEGNFYAFHAVKWKSRTAERVWMALGWSEWNDWSSCSEFCSSGIQQRARICKRNSGKCPGHNVEQRFCNLFRCDRTANPLLLKNEEFYHPSKDKWKIAPDRVGAWRMETGNYLSAPSNKINLTDFPAELSMFFTIRLRNRDFGGKLLSFRSKFDPDNYVAIILERDELKLIHATRNYSDSLIIPVELKDYRWRQIALSFRDGNKVDFYLDCEWISTDFHGSNLMAIHGEFDLIIGHSFQGDVEQISLNSDPEIGNSHCSTETTPINDNVDFR